MTGAIFEAILSHWRRHPTQLVTLFLGLALATALWSGVQAVNAEARKSYAAASVTLGQGTFDRLQGPISTAEYAALRRAGVLVSPVIEAPLAARGAVLTLRGIDPLTTPPLPALAGMGDGTYTLEDFTQAPGLLLASPETAGRLEGLDLPPIVVAPDLPSGEVLADIATVMRLTGAETFSYLVIDPDQPRGAPELADLTDLPRMTPEPSGDIASLTESFHLNLTAFGLLAFAVGLFIVQAAIGLAFEQRRPVIRTLRALGVSLPRLLTCLALELVAFGVLAGAAGLVLGYIFAALLMPGVAATLRGLYGAEIDGVLGFDPTWALAGMAITLLGAVFAGSFALWRVVQMPLLTPAQPRAWAMASDRVTRWQLVAGLILMAVSLVLGLWGTSLIAGFACLAALLLGAALVLPAFLSAALAACAPFARRPLSEWLVADARQQVPALSLALMALLLALAANIGVSTMVGSFRTTFTGWLDQRLASELYLTARTEAEAEDIRAWLTADERVGAALPIWSVEAPIAGQPGDVFGVVDHSTYRNHWPLLAASDAPWDALAMGEGVLINEQLARSADLWPGDTLLIDDGWETTIVGVYSDYGNPRAQAMAGTLDLADRYPNVPVLRYAIRTAPDTANDLAQTIKAELGLADSQIRNQQAVKSLSLEIFERTFLVTGALNILTLSVAAFAMLASLLTLSALRLPQIAPVWAVGETPARLARLEVLRTLLLAALTWCLAVPVGLALAWVLLVVVNVEAFGWRLPMRLFPADWVLLGVLAILAALVAAIWPALALFRMPPGALLRVFANER